MGAFAANSLLCRAALTHTRIDAATFTAVRLAAGALVLTGLSGRANRLNASGAGWASALALFVYAAAFSFAYLRLQTGVGALVLFGAVQLSMIGWGVARGERPHARVWLGLALALGGLLGLTLPGANAPDALGATLMGIAGLGWGVYSLRGRGVADPIGATAGNFARALPFAFVLWWASGAHASGVPLDGLALAVLSGGLASGVGYALWYTALRHLLALQASVVQLSVPVLAAGLGIVLLGEPLTVRLSLAGLAILGGIALSVLAPRTHKPS